MKDEYDFSEGKRGAVMEKEDHISTFAQMAQTIEEIASDMADMKADMTGIIDDVRIIMETTDETSEDAARMVGKTCPIPVEEEDKARDEVYALRADGVDRAAREVSRMHMRCHGDENGGFNPRRELPAVEVTDGDDDPIVTKLADDLATGKFLAPPEPLPPLVDPKEKDRESKIQELEIKLQARLDQIHSLCDALEESADPDTYDETPEMKMGSTVRLLADDVRGLLTELIYNID
jgi:hypothetical protein